MDFSSEKHIQPFFILSPSPNIVANPNRHFTQCGMALDKTPKTFGGEVPIEGTVLRPFSVSK